MRVTVITSPCFLPDEASLLEALLAYGADRIHLRKPGCSEQELACLIEQLPPHCLPRLSLHDHFGLTERYGIGGIHLNGRNPVPPPGYRGIVSRSCHSLSEVAQYKAEVDYLFLSPIFDSISKTGYQAAFPRRCWTRRRARASSTGRWWPWAAYRHKKCPRCEPGALEAWPCWVPCGGSAARWPTPGWCLAG